MSYAADLSHLEAAVSRLGPLLERTCVVVGKSTVPVGTAAGVAQRLVDLAPAGVEVRLAWNPEFLREGLAIDDTLRPGRLVFGAADTDGSGRAEEVLREAYAETIAAGTPVVVTDLATAELTKVAANAFLATKISFINAMAEVCEASGADVTMLAEAIGHDPRIGRGFLNAGLGFGGGCLPKDIRAFIARAGELGAGRRSTFLREVDAINQRAASTRGRSRGRAAQPTWPGCPGGRVGGGLQAELRRHQGLAGAERGRTPAPVRRARDRPRPAGDGQRTPELADPVVRRQRQRGVHDASLTLVLTEWAAVPRDGPGEPQRRRRDRRVVDGRNCLDPAQWRAAGWTYRGMGRP